MQSASDSLSSSAPPASRSSGGWNDDDYDVLCEGTCPNVAYARHAWDINVQARINGTLRCSVSWETAGGSDKNNPDHLDRGQGANELRGREPSKLEFRTSALRLLSTIYRLRRNTDLDLDHEGPSDGPDVRLV